MLPGMKYQKPILWLWGCNPVFKKHFYMWCILCCPRLSCNLTEMWDKERDISIQVLDLMETDFIEIFRVKTWLLLWLAKPAVGLVLDCNAAYKTAPCGAQPRQSWPPTACGRLAEPGQIISVLRTNLHRERADRGKIYDWERNSNIQIVRHYNYGFWNIDRLFFRATLFVSFHWRTRLVMWFCQGLVNFL